MILISHRANIDKVEPKWENHPDKIKEALSSGFNVEVDVWMWGENIYLGHDKPQYYCETWIKEDPRIWFHCKNIDALDYFNFFNKIHFWHQNDDYALTSNGYIWTYPGKELTAKSIAVLPINQNKQSLLNISGICSDEIAYYKDIV